MSVVVAGGVWSSAVSLREVSVGPQQRVAEVSADVSAFLAKFKVDAFGASVARSKASVGLPSRSQIVVSAVFNQVVHPLPVGFG